MLVPQGRHCNQRDRIALREDVYGVDMKLIHCGCYSQGVCVGLRSLVTSSQLRRTYRMRRTRLSTPARTSWSALRRPTPRKFRELLERVQGRYGRQAEGFSTFTTPAKASGLHCTVILDGAEISDPGSTAYFGGSKWANAAEVPEAGDDDWPRDVPFYL